MICHTYTDDIKDNYTIVGLPSGEVFDVNGLQLYNLYENDLIEFDYKREFWAFRDIDVDQVKLRFDDRRFNRY